MLNGRRSVWPNSHRRAQTTDAASWCSSYYGGSERALAELLVLFVPEIAHVHLLKGRAGEEIAMVAADELIDVVVMGTLCRSGISGWLIGNTAETVVDQIQLSKKKTSFTAPVPLRVQCPNGFDHTALPLLLCKPLVGENRDQWWEGVDWTGVRRSRLTPAISTSTIVPAMTPITALSNISVMPARTAPAGSIFAIR